MRSLTKCRARRPVVVSSEDGLEGGVRCVEDGLKDRIRGGKDGLSKRP